MAPHCVRRRYAAYAILLAANIFLTGLQIFWTGQICDGVFEALG
jgi:hypothetical protein